MSIYESIETLPNNSVGTLSFLFRDLALRDDNIIRVGITIAVILTIICIVLIVRQRKLKKEIQQLRELIQDKP